MSNPASKSYELMEWDAPEKPTLALLNRILHRENLQPEEQHLSPGKTQEMKFNQGVVYVLVSGTLYVSLPGYGVVDLSPGDILEINPKILHDITVTGHQDAVLLKALKN